jgi:lactoylglutathione lyase
MSDREGVIELSHEYGTEDDPTFKPDNKNSSPQGFAHICISVDSIEAACQRVSRLGYRIQKRLDTDPDLDFAFVLDPDDYLVQIMAQSSAPDPEDSTITDTKKYRINHTMLRVKDKDISVKFYEEVLGMKLRGVSEQQDSGFNIYCLGYSPPLESNTVCKSTAEANYEGQLQLKWYYGTEKEEGKVYHDGNTDPKGFGHICVSVDDIQVACQRWEDMGAAWHKRLDDGPFRVAFMLDPDGYVIVSHSTLNYEQSLLTICLVCRDHSE